MELVGYLILAQLCNFCCICVHSVRLNYNLESQIGFKNALKVSLQYFGASAVLPARLGELVRTVLLKKQMEIPFSSSIPLIITLQSYELIVLAANITYLIMQGMAHLDTQYIQYILFFASFILGVASLIYLLAIHFKSKFLEIIRGAVLSYLAAFKPRKFLLNILLMLLAWFLALLTIECVLDAFDIKHNVANLDLILVGMILGMLLPIFPGALGTFEAGVWGALSILVIENEMIIYIVVLLRLSFYCIPFIYFLYAAKGHIGSFAKMIKTEMLSNTAK